MSDRFIEARAGSCPVCAEDHKGHVPHNFGSLFYILRFKQKHGRAPTPADAIAHCHPDLKEHWEIMLRDNNAWSEPESGQPIAEHPDDYTSEPVKIPDDVNESELQNWIQTQS